MKRFILIFIIILCGCKLFNSSTEETDSPPEIVSKSPTESVLDQKIGDSIQFSINAIDADDDPISYRTLVDDVPVNDSNNFTFVVPDLGTYTIQMDAYNDEIDSEIWTVNVGNTAPVIGYLSNVTGKEDNIEVGSTVKTASISDHEDSLEDLVVELSQTNSDLIKFALDDNYNIIIEDYLENGNGSSGVTIKVTDSHGAITEKSFTYNIAPMTDIEGSVLDSDTWEPNNALQGFAIIQGDTIWTDANGKYKTQINPATSIDIEAGYRSLDKTQPMSFITTARSIGANSDKSGVDIMVVTYLNNNMTPEEFRIMAWETNFSALDKNYTGAKVPSVGMKDYLVKENYTGDIFTDAEINDVKRVIADSINTHLKHPFPLVEINYFDPRTEAERQDVTKWMKNTTSNPAIGTLDFNNDGIVDYTYIKSPGDDSANGSGIYYDWFISNLLEEGYGSRGQFGPVTHPSLEGKTIAYEYKGTEWVKQADIKFIKVIEGIAYQICYLIPKIPLDDVFKIQE